MTTPTDPKPPETTSTSLIVRVKNHDEEAWRRLVDLYSRLVLYWCRSQNVPTQDRRDILQDVFRAAFASIDRFSKSKPGDTFRGWLRSVTRSRIADYYKQQARTGFVQTEQMLDTLAARLPAELEEKEESILVRRARRMVLTKCDEKTRQAVEMLMQGLTSTEVGRELGMKPVAVRAAKRRVKAMLKEFEGLFHLAGTPAENEKGDGDSFEET